MYRWQYLARMPPTPKGRPQACYFPPNSAARMFCMSPERLWPFKWSIPCLFWGSRPLKRHISHAHESPRCCQRLHQDSPARAAEQEETENPITAQRSLDHAFCDTTHRTKERCCLRPVKQGRKHVHPVTPPKLAGHLPAMPVPGPALAPGGFKHTGLEPAQVRNRTPCPQIRSHSLFDMFPLLWSSQT